MSAERTEWTGPRQGSTVRELLTELLMVGHPLATLDVRVYGEVRTDLRFLGPAPMQPKDIARAMAALRRVLPAGSLESALAPTAVKPASPPAAEPSAAAGALPLGHAFNAGQHGFGADRCWHVSRVVGRDGGAAMCCRRLSEHLPPTEQAGIGGAAASPGAVPPASTLEGLQPNDLNQIVAAKASLLAPSGDPFAPGGAFDGALRLRGDDIVGADKLERGAALLRMRHGGRIVVDAEALRKLAALEFVSAVGL